MIFLFPRWDMLIPWRVTIISRVITPVTHLEGHLSGFELHLQLVGAHLVMVLKFEDFWTQIWPLGIIDCVLAGMIALRKCSPWTSF